MGIDLETVGGGEGSSAGVPVSTGEVGWARPCHGWREMDRCQIYFGAGLAKAVDDLGWRMGIERSLKCTPRF